MGAPAVYKVKGMGEPKAGEAVMQSLKSSASGKAKARYPSGTETIHQNMSGGAVKHRAVTPGGPSGS